MTRRRRRALARSLPTCRASQPSGGVCCYRGSGRARREGERRRLSARALIALSVAFAGARALIALSVAFAGACTR